MAQMTNEPQPPRIDDATSGDTLFQLERHELIVDRAMMNGHVDVRDLAERLKVTTETIRRDLSQLQDQRLLRRVHGGAVPWQRWLERIAGDLARRAAARVRAKLGSAQAIATKTTPTDTVTSTDLETEDFIRGAPYPSHNVQHQPNPHSHSATGSRPEGVLGDVVDLPQRKPRPQLTWGFLLRG